MIEKNFEYLCEQHKEFGFGNSFNEQLKEKMSNSEPTIQLNDRIRLDDQTIVEATLSYSKSAESEMYFWNNYQLHDVPSEDGVVDQTFYVNKMNTFKVDEALKLLNGRSVYKTMQSLDKNLYSAWFSIDFTQKNQNGNFKVERSFGFNAEKEIRKLPIPGIDEKDSSLSSEIATKVKKGEIVGITLEKDGVVTNVKIGADGVNKKFIGYDQNFNNVDLTPFIQYKSELVKAEKEAKRAKENVAENIAAEQTEKKERKKKFGIF